MRIIVTFISLAAALAALSGCAAGSALGVKKQDFQNRLTMTTACDQVRTDSQWFGLFGVSASIDERDAKPVLAARCGRGPEPVAALPAAAAASAPK